MKVNITTNRFVSLMKDTGFTDYALRKLYDYFEEMEREGADLSDYVNDSIAVRGDFVEYDDLESLADDYCITFDMVDDIREDFILTYGEDFMTDRINHALYMDELREKMKAALEAETTVVCFEDDCILFNNF